MNETCAYCKPNNTKTLVGRTGEYISAWVKIYINKEDVRLGLNAEGETSLSKSVKINFCPMCGRKFENK